MARVIEGLMKIYDGFSGSVVAINNNKWYGLGKKLIETIINHPKLKNIKSIELVCRKEMMIYQRLRSCIILKCREMLHNPGVGTNRRSSMGHRWAPRCGVLNVLLKE